MENPIYIALSRQDALRRQIEVVAHNVANMNTPGFKGQRMQFVEYLAPIGDSQKMAMVQDRAVIRDLTPGPISRTGNPLDLALEGDGYFTVETPEGPRYTRAGHFQLDAERRIVDPAGLPVLDENDQPVAVPQDALHVTVHADGTLATDQGPLGRLKLVRFERPQFMTELGRGLYASNEPPLPADTTRVVQGALEQSNIQPIVEMTQMTEILRQYQSNQRLMESEHERQRTAIQRLARTQ